MPAPTFFFLGNYGVVNIEEYDNDICSVVDKWQRMLINWSKPGSIPGWLRRSVNMGTISCESQGCRTVQTHGNMFNPIVRHPGREIVREIVCGTVH
jgi:hypothetical protein